MIRLSPFGILGPGFKEVGDLMDAMLKELHERAEEFKCKFFFFPKLRLSSPKANSIASPRPYLLRLD
jgi:hypothetical protein